MPEQLLTAIAQCRNATLDIERLFRAMPPDVEAEIWRSQTPDTLSADKTDQCFFFSDPAASAAAAASVTGIKRLQKQCLKAKTGFSLF